MKWSDTGGGDFEQPPIGTQRGEYQGKVNIRRQCIIGWELPTELMQEGDLAGQPFIVSRFYTASLGKKANLRADLQSWRGREFTEEELDGFESKNILGKPCMLSLIKNEKDKVKISGVMAMPKGMDIPAQKTPSVYFSLDAFDREVFEALSDGIKKMITVSPEYEIATKPIGQARPAQPDDLDDIPF